MRYLLARPLVAALARLPNQSVTKRKPSKVPLHAWGEDLAIPFTINGRSATYAFDTGNFAVMVSRSEAKRLGLRIYKTDTDVKVNGLSVQIAIADQLEVGNFRSELREQHGSKENIAIDPRMFATVCSPGANVVALWHRASILGLIVQQTGLLTPELPDDARDIVFNVAAKFPIKLMQPGVVYDGAPLDVQAFVKQIEDELGRLGF